MKIILLLFLSVSGYSQEKYFVSHVGGKVKNVKTNTYLKVGSTILLSDSLIFFNHTNFVSVVSPTKGIKLLKYDKPSSPNTPNEFISSVSSILLPVLHTKTMAGRAGMINSLYDFENYLKTFSDTTTCMLIIDNDKIPLGKGLLPDRQNQFFFIRYKLKNADINKKLSFIEPKKPSDTLFLLLDKNLYVVDGKPVAPAGINEVTFFSYNATSQESTMLGNARIRIVNEVDILPEICLLYATLRQYYQNKEDMTQQILQDIKVHIGNNYGVVDEEKLKMLMDKVTTRPCNQ